MKDAAAFLEHMAVVAHARELDKRKPDAAYIGFIKELLRALRRARKVMQ